MPCDHFFMVSLEFFYLRAPFMTRTTGKIKLVQGGDIIIKEKAHNRQIAKRGFFDDENEDALSWVVKLKKKEGSSKLKDNYNENKSSKTYKEDELKGLKVKHDLEELLPGESEILVLKDVSVLETEDAENPSESEAKDELISTKLIEKQKLDKNLYNKKKSAIYKGYEDEEDRLGPDGKISLLPQYDDNEFELGMKETKAKGFVIGETGKKKETKNLNEQDDHREKGEGSYVDLNANEYKEMKDTYSTEEIKHILQPIHKKRKTMRKAEDSDLANIINKDESIAKKIKFDSVLDGDIEYQASLERSRKTALQKIRIPKPEDIIHSEKSDQKDEILPVKGSQQNETSSLVYSEVTEFVNRISATAKAAQDKKLRAPLFESMNDNDGSPISENNMAENENQVVTSSCTSQISEERESSTSVSIGKERLVSQGVGSTLMLLRQKGIVRASSELQKEEAQRFKERQKWMMQKHTEELIQQSKQKAFKEREKASKNVKDKESLEKERKRPQDSSKRGLLSHHEGLEEKFKNYTPVLNLDKYDDYGRKLDPKEAYKELSHTFHGKGSGKMKIDKKLKKIESEKLFAKMSSTDTPLHAASALLQKQKKQGTAHITLSVGNRAAVGSIEKAIEPRKSSSSFTPLEKSNAPPKLEPSSGNTSVSGNISIISTKSNESRSTKASEPGSKGKIFGFVKRT